MLKNGGATRGEEKTTPAAEPTGRGKKRRRHDTNKQRTGLPSLRAAKLRLYDVMIELASPLATSVRFHCPMQGPHALASTVPPTFKNTSVRPSRSMVARICSLPVLVVRCVFLRVCVVGFVSGVDSGQFVRDGGLSPPPSARDKRKIKKPTGTQTQHGQKG